MPALWPGDGTLHDDYFQALTLADQGTSFLKQYESSGLPANLEEAIGALRNANEFLPDDHGMKAACLNNLGISFDHRFECLGNVVDLNKAMAAQQQAVHLTPEGHPGKPGRLNNLGISFYHRFKRLGNVVDLDEAIAAQQQAVHLTPEGHPDKPACLNSLRNSFHCRFERLGEIFDLDEVITAQQQAVHLNPEGHPDKPGHLNSLGNSFHCQFECLGDIVDLNKVITAQQQAVHLTPEGHPGKPTCLNNLGISFHRRFERFGNVVNLDEAITAKQQAVHLTPEGRPDKPRHLSNLGNSFCRQFERLRDSVDLDQAITAQQQAVHLTPEGHPEKPSCLNNLGNSLQSQFEHLGDVVNLDEAITAQQQAVHLIPEGHPDKPAYLNNLGSAFLHRSQLQQDHAPFTQAITMFLQSAKSSSGSPPHCFVAAKQWARLCLLINSREILNAYSTLVNLIPHLIWLGRTIEQRYQDISQIGNAMVDAVAAAIHFGEFNLALEWAEQGQSIVWGQILQLRTPLDELREKHPHEAKELEEISRALDSAGVISHGHLGPLSDGTPWPLEDTAQAHRRLAEVYDRTLERIRDIPEFHEFLQPKKSKSLCSVATSGPVVIVNASKTRCDALILRPHSLQVLHVPLPEFTFLAVQEMGLDLVNSIPRGEGSIPQHYKPAERMMVSDILAHLWSDMVEPILRSLEVSLLFL